jgi:dTDP-4-dehydrorhamnose reductase
MSKPKILLFGRNGQLGWELHRSLAPLGDLRAVDKEELDLNDHAALERFILDENPRLIVNAAAFTDVDGAEENSELAFSLNETAPRIMARACRKIGAALVHYSTDYVFDGTKSVPYTENDEPDPINTYGQSKLEGEVAVAQAGIPSLIFRTSWVYSFRQPSFPTKVLEWAKVHKQLRIVTDQVGSPTWARMLAQATTIAIGQGKTDIPGWIQQASGIYHLAGKGHASRFQFAQRILENISRNSGQAAPSVVQAISDDFPTPARRPSYSALECGHFEKQFGFQLPAWSEALDLAMDSFNW